MNIMHLTPGAGGMYCGGCFRDQALVAALRRLGHDTLQVPLYLPLNLDEPSASGQTPVFFGGINVYLEQQYSWFQKTPRWFRRLLSSEFLLKRIGKMAAKTRPSDTGDMTVSMLKGEDGRQAAELEELIQWLQSQFKPHMICLSNALLIGMARRLKRDLKTPVVCTFQGEDGFLDALAQPYRTQSWQILGERAADIDLFIAPSQFYAELMGKRMGLADEKIKIVHNGIELNGFEVAAAQNPPVLGYFARMCPEKGLDILVNAYLLLKQRNRVPGLKLKIGGSLGPTDEPFVESLKDKLRRGGVFNQTEFCPNLDRGSKIAFYRSLSVFSVPVRCNEAFGLYIAEAMASGVPVVQPKSSSFPELLSLSGGGVLYEPGNLNALAEAIEGILLNREQAVSYGEAARNAALDKFNIDSMASQMAAVYASVITQRKNLGIGNSNS